MVREILLLGNEDLYKISSPIKKDELNTIFPVIQDLKDTLFSYREKYKAGRAIAAPQIGVRKRLIYMYIDKPIVFINPSLEFSNNETIEILDDCMSFPNLLVKVRRYKKCIVKYLDENWQENEIMFENDLSELIQHEYDHLDGVLATMRAINNKSLILKN